MNKIFRNNKILWIAVAIILVGGSCLTIALVSCVNLASATKALSLILPNSAQSDAQTTSGSQASSVPASFSAQTLQKIVQEREHRRTDRIIPFVSSAGLTEADTWVKMTPSNSGELEKAAFQKCAALAQTLFSYKMDQNYSISYYTDTSEARDGFVKIATSDGVIVCTLSTDTLALINIDYALDPNLLPKLDALSASGSSEISEEAQSTAEKIALLMSAKVSDIRRSQSKNNSEVETIYYYVELNNKTFFAFATLNGKLYAIGVYPTEGCMEEHVYFKADVRRDKTVVRLVSPQNFSEGEPGVGDMTKQEALQMYREFLIHAAGSASYEEPSEIKFYIDHSGARENYWHVAGDRLQMDIAAKSRWIVSLACDGLVNPENDLTKLESLEGGSYEYYIYVKNIMRSLFGDSLVRVASNGVEGSSCTLYAWMNDKTAYEFSFKEGRLVQVEFYFDDEYCGSVSGWKADNLWINDASGETFINENYYMFTGGLQK